MRTPLPRTVRTAAVAVAAVSTLGLSACGGDTAGTEAGADVEDVVEEEPPADGPYDGVYDSAFYDEVDSYAGEEVTLSADVDEVITPEAFTIAGTDDTSVEALLVVGATGDTELAPETTVGVTGTVMESFVLTDVEEDLGVDLDDALFAEWEQEPYVVAESVAVLENAEG
ncbi:hypothetical protein [Geodermatophilus sp. DSM 45219]|uniref:hypothetical protein n=1 Tax=Geodermatophilus sp. DSM 45219 TaxID=1881103 RepID=UPI0008837CFD|nr:hypothetical protein [Geodermatophilus sp. DSM 45219]SDN76047.1 hypothetical protein SAMN05428965_1498 [Geodermatophilus sp. DSM 45219]